MSRTSQGPRLRLFGPDDRHGAKPRKGFREYRWYVLWQEGGQRRERATGLDHRATAEEREAALSAFLDEQDRGRRPSGPRHPDQMTVAEALTLYGENHAPTTSCPERIGYTIEALTPWWGEAKISAITAAACRRYLADRKAAIAKARADQRALVEARYREQDKAPPPPLKRLEASDGTIRRELGTLRAAVNWCHLEGYLVQPPAVWLPDRPQSKERWLTRQEAAKLIRAARKIERSNKYLPLFILIGLYTGARKEAILGLQWQPNTVGGRIDLERGLIDYRKPGQAQTAKRRTAIPIPPRLRPFLEAARRRTRQYVLEYRAPTTEERERGIVAIPIKDTKKAIASAARAANLTDVTPHTLRHSAVTWLVQSGVPLWEVAQWVGMSVEMIERVYGHHAPDRFQRVLGAQR
ncbi:tyrosine-type recombinase/integrase [Paramagnetospirillum magneticum]|nr:site-specific integrase [Paramagnetospirillum magneticum]